ncbi:MAG: cation:proton antiporter [Pseudobacteriovorax sp.]|nr:cation:proton antiporter [Pseudobacteriovorax sp.]
MEDDTLEQAGFLYYAFIYLIAGVVAVPIAKRLGLGSVLGYLLAGVIIGPFGLSLISENFSAVMHFAEFGVVMMLFLVGLELQPSLLWKLRGPILGTGGAQVLVTSILVFAVSLALGMPTQYAIAIGLILSLSSTAIVLQTLAEKNWMKRSAGQSSFAVLLFQDIAVIPMLAILPLLAIESASSAEGGHSMSIIADLHGGLQAIIVILSVGSIIVGGRYLARPLFRFIAQTGLREIFTAAALLLVIGIALLMQLVGLSPALGAFVAGVVLANNEYRHELESDIEPFKGLLLGLFFISVGAGIDFSLIVSQPGIIIGLTVLLMFGKFVVLYVVGKVSRLSNCENLLFSLALAQAGEFAFVLFSFSQTNNILPKDIIDTLTVVVALSMLATPLLIILYDKVLEPLIQGRLSSQPVDDHDPIENDEPDVILAGFGRFGTVVGRLLMFQGFKVTVLDHNAGQIEALRKFGFKIFFGDATRVDLLEAAGASHAKLLIIGLDGKEQINNLLEALGKHFPRLPVVTRAVDRDHTYELLNKGIPMENIYRELFGASMSASERALQILGFRKYRAYQTVQLFRHHDIRILEELRAHRGDQESYIAQVKYHRQRIEDLLRQDEGDSVASHPDGWVEREPVNS